MKIFIELFNYAFRVLLITYIVAVCLEALLPGFVSISLSLDFFLWLVILLSFVFVFFHFFLARPNRS